MTDIPPPIGLPDTNRFLDDAAARIRARQEDTALNVFHAAHADPIGPDEEARIRRLARRRGVSRHQMPTAPEQLDVMEFEDDLRDVFTRYPNLLRRAQDVDRVRMMTDDRGNLRTTASTFDFLRRNFEAGQVINERGLLGARAAFGKDTAADRARIEDIDRVLQAAATEDGMFATAVQFAGQMFEPIAASMGTAFAAGAVAGAATGPGSVAAAPVAFKATLATSFFAHSAITEGGNQFLDMRAQGFSENESRVGAAVYGLGAGVLEILGVRFAAKPFQAAIRPLQQKLLKQAAEPLTEETARHAFRSFAKEYGMSVGGEAVTEAMQEGLGFAVEAAVRMVSGASVEEPTWGEVFGQIGDAFVKSAKGMAILGIPGPTAHLAVNVQRARRAGVTQQFFEQLKKGADESKHAERDADSYADTIDGFAQGEGAENVYVEVEEFHRALAAAGTNAVELERDVPVVSALLREAERAGTPVVIPTGDFAAHIARRTPLYEALRPFARLESDGMSLEEQEAFRQNEGDERKEVAAEAEAAADAGESLAISGARVEARIRDELNKTGKQTRREAALGAKLHRAFVETNARELNLTPEEFDERWRLKVVGPPKERGLPLPELLQNEGEQTAPNSSPPSATREAPQPGTAEELRSGERGSFLPKRREMDQERYGAFLATLTDKADVSTFLHESAHFYLTAYADLAASPAATDRIRADMQALLDWFGVKDLATWNAMSIEQQRNHHETFASNFELYLFEGKAPSLELQSWFDRFSGWLRTLWRQLTGRHPRAAFEAETGQELRPLNDKVRAVMDRMLASEDQIQHAESVRSVQPLFRSQEEAGMTDAEWEQYRVQAARSQEAAIASLSREALRDLRWLANVPRERRAEAQDLRDEVRREVAEEVRLEPVYRAERFLRHGEFVAPDGTTTNIEGAHKMDSDAVRALLPKGAKLTQLGGGKYGMTTPGGASPEVVADRFGYSSAGALVRALLEAPKLDAVIDSRTDRRLFEEHAEFVTPEAMELAVDRALFSEERERLVESEMARHAGGEQPARMLRRVAKQHAKDVIADTLVGRIRPHLHAVAAGKQARLALDAARRGENDRVAAAKRAELIQIQLAKTAAAAREEVQKAFDDFDRVWRSDKDLAKTHNVDVIAAARAVLAAFGHGKSDRAPAQHLEAVRTHDPDLFAELEPLVIGAVKDAKHWEDLTLTEFRDMRDAVDALIYKARRSEVVRRDGVWHSVQTAVGEMVEQLGVSGEQVKAALGKLDRARRGLIGIRGHLTQVEHMLRGWDGGKSGPFTRWLWGEIRERLTDYRLARNEKVAELVANIRKLNLKRGRIDLEDQQGNVLYTFGNGNGGMGKAELIGALLHSGNESNLRRLLLAERHGERWGALREDDSVDSSTWDAFVQRMIDQGTITKDDMEFVQSVWGLTESLLPLAQRAHRDVFGYRMSEIPARSFSLRFPDGETVQYAGGYVPAKIDRDAAPELNLPPEEVTEDFRWGMPQAPHGFAKGRVEPFAAPLVLDVSMIANHIDEVLLFSHVQPAVRDAARLLRNRDLRGAIARSDPKAMKDVLTPWLDRAATQRLTKPGGSTAANAFWAFVRRNTGVAIMFANPVNTAQQITGLSNALNYVGMGYLARASKRVLPHMFNSKRLRESIGSRSPFMKERLENQVFGLRDELQRLLTDTTWLGKVQRWTVRHAYFAQAWLQNIVDMTVWMGAYDKAMAERPASWSEERAEAAAIEEADKVVRLSQGSFDPEDVAAYQSGTPFARTWFQFSGYFNSVLNQVIHQPDRVAQGRAALVSLAIPAILGEVIAKTLWGTWDDEDDDGYLDEAGEVLLGSQARAAGALVPGFGPAVTNVVDSLFTDRPFGDRGAQSPAMATLYRSVHGLIDAMRQAADGDREMHGQALRNALTGVTVGLGPPLSVLGRPAGYLLDVGRGAIEPTGVFDAIRGTVTGRPSEASRR